MLPPGLKQTPHHHDQEQVDPIDVSDIVQCADVGMIECADSPRLSLETSDGRGVIHEVQRQHLDGHRSIEPVVAGLVHLAMPPAPKRRWSS